MEKLDINYYKKRTFNNSESLNLLSTLKQKNSKELGEIQAINLIKSGNIAKLAKNLSEFEGLTTKTANKLIEYGYKDLVAKNLSSFKNLDKKIAIILMDERIGAVSSNLSSFTKLDDAIAKSLINYKSYDQIAKNIYVFSNLSLETLLVLLLNCKRGKHLMVTNRTVFGKRGEPNDLIISKLNKEGRIEESKKLKEFYDAIIFEDEKKSFNSRYDLSKSFGIEVVKCAIKYGKLGLVIKNIYNYTGNFKNLVNLFIDENCIDGICKILGNLWGKNIDWNRLIKYMASNNKYNEIITNSEIFENGGISELEIAKQIVKQSDPEFRDCVTNLGDYSDDDMDWNRINYNLDMYRLVQENKKLEFVQLFKYFQFDYPELSKEEGLPLKLKNLVKSKFGSNMIG